MHDLLRHLFGLNNWTSSLKFNRANNDNKCPSVIALVETFEFSKAIIDGIKASNRSPSPPSKKKATAGKKRPKKKQKPQIKMTTVSSVSTIKIYVK
jgi:hypothetical protein